MNTKKVMAAEKPVEDWLLALRQGTAKFEFCKKALLLALNESGKTLSDIGSSEEEIQQLEIENPRKVGIRNAKFWLNKLRTTHKGNPLCQTQVLRMIHQHNLSLEEIGATEDHLKILE